MTIFFHTLTTGVCLLFALKGCATIKNSLILTLLAMGLGLIHGLAPTISNTFGSLTYSHDRLYAAAYSFFGILLLLTGVHSTSSRNQLHIRNSLDQQLIHNRGRTILIFWICAIVGIIGFLTSFWIAGIRVDEVVQSGRFTFRFQGGAVAAILRYSTLLCVFPGFLGFFISRRYMVLGLVYAFIAATLIFFLTKGTRGNSIGILAGMISGYILSRPIITNRHIAFLGASALSIVLLAVSLYSVRRVMNYQDYGALLTIIFSASSYTDLFNRDPLNYNEVFVEVVRGVPFNCDYLPFASLRRILFFYVPSNMFPSLKPEDVNITLAREVFRMPAHLRVSIPPSIPGDAYVNFGGLPGLIYLFVQGCFIGYVSAKMRSSWVAFIAISPIAVHLILLGLRGQPYEVSLQMAFAVVFVKTCELLTNLIQPRSSNPTSLNPRRQINRSGTLR
jgi:hypothetical protein